MASSHPPRRHEPPRAPARRHGRAARAPRTGTPAGSCTAPAPPPRRPPLAHTTAPSPISRTTEAARSPSTATSAVAGAPSPSCFGSSGTAAAASNPRASRRPPRAPTLTPPSIRSTRNVLRIPLSCSKPDDVPEPVPRQQAVRIEVTDTAAVRKRTVARRAFASNRLARAGGDGSAATSGAASPSSASPAQLQQGQAAGLTAEPDRGHRELQGVALLRCEAEVGQLVGGPVDPVTGRAAAVARQHPLLDRHAQLPQLGLVALERAPARRPHRRGTGRPARWRSARGSAVRWSRAAGPGGSPGAREGRPSARTLSATRKAGERRRSLGAWRPPPRLRWRLG